MGRVNFANSSRTVKLRDIGKKDTMVFHFLSYKVWGINKIHFEKRAVKKEYIALKLILEVSHLLLDYFILKTSSQLMSS